MIKKMFRNNSLISKTSIDVSLTESDLGGKSINWYLLFSRGREHKSKKQEEQKGIP